MCIRDRPWRDWGPAEPLWSTVCTVPSSFLCRFCSGAKRWLRSLSLVGVLILASVVLSSSRGFGGAITRRQFWIGCGLGALSMATVTFAIVLVRPLLYIY